MLDAFFGPGIEIVKNDGRNSGRKRKQKIVPESVNECTVNVCRCQHKEQ